MAKLAQIHRDQHQRIKNNVEMVINKNLKNVQRYWDSARFVYKSAMDNEERNNANDLGRPTLESNILEPYISRQVGEISRQLPDPLVTPIVDDPNLAAQAQVVENHIRHIFEDAINIRVESFEQSISRGFYVFKICTDYIKNESFDQAIFIRPVDNPTSCGFDPSAKESHKGDGNFCFHMVPKTEEEFKEEYPGFDFSQIRFGGDNKTWAYYDKDTKVIMICEYFEKKCFYKKMLLVSNPLHPDALLSLYEDQYEELLASAMAEGRSEGELPIVLKEAKRKIEKIIKYELNGSEILERKETDWKYFPLIWCDGNSKKLKNEEMTRPLVYHAMDPQKAKNVAFQSIVNQIENQGQTDEYLPIAGLPVKEEFKQAWMEPQRKHIAKFWQHVDENGNPIPPPNKIPVTPVDASTVQFYEMMSDSVQQSMGSYDAQQGRIDNPGISGIAIKNGSIQSNSATMPYVIRFMQAWTQAAKVCVDLMPKYYTTLRSIPIIDRDGKHSYQLINNSLGDPTYKLEYEESDMQVKVKMDLSFEIQKQVALENIEMASKFSPNAAEFFGTEGFHFVLDNMTFKDSSKVKEEFQQFMQKKSANAAEAQQMIAATNPVIAQTKIAAMRADSEEKDRKLDLVKTITDANLEERKLELEESKVQADVIESRDRVVNEYLKTQAENARSKAEAAIALDKHVYDKLQSDREHSLKVRDSDREHVLKMLDMIGDIKNEKVAQKAPQEENAIEERQMLGE